MQDRYLTYFIKKDLEKKMILLSGPRQSGKTTLAQALMNESSIYLNWDIPRDRLMLTRQSWPSDTQLLILDELHKLRTWKNYLKGLYDDRGKNIKIVVTGSARLETFRKAGDALTGRYYHYHLHPIDLVESKDFLPGLSSTVRLTRLLSAGGFPESFLHPMDAPRLLQNRFEQVVDTDLRDLSQIRNVTGVATLIELLRERVGGTISFANLASDLAVSPPTVKSWLEILERLYIVFIVRPWTQGLARSIRKEPKVFFYDSSAALEPAARLENAVACSLLKYGQLANDTLGKRWALWFIRDRDGNEVDFVVTEGRKVHWAIEVKTADTKPSRGLVNMFPKLNGHQAIQLVQHCDLRQNINNIAIEPLATWLDQLPKHMGLATAR